MSVEPVYCVGRKTLANGTEVGTLLVDWLGDPVEVCGPPIPFRLTRMGKWLALRQELVVALVCEEITDDQIDAWLARRKREEGIER